MGLEGDCATHSSFSTVGVRRPNHLRDPAARAAPIFIASNRPARRFESLGELTLGKAQEPTGPAKLEVSGA
jgi:hypothetical protein